MKSKLITTTIIILLLASSSYGMLVQAKPNGLKPGIDFSGPHFNLIVHGVPKDGDKPVPDYAGSGRHSIFVPLTTTDHINIYISMEGIEWKVEDCDATGDGTASIILPRELWEDTNGDGILDTKIGNVRAYRVYVVGLGKPGEFTNIILPGATVDSDSQTIYWELTDQPLTVERRKGQPIWKNATYLFEATVWLWEADLDGDGNWWIGDTWDGTLADCDPGEVVAYENYWVFDIPGLLGYWWDVTNTGIRVMQVRFYPILNGNGNG